MLKRLGLGFGAQGAKSAIDILIGSALHWWDVSDLSKVNFQTGSTIGGTVSFLEDKAVGNVDLTTYGELGFNSAYPALIYGTGGVLSLSTVDDNNATLVTRSNDVYRAGRTYVKVGRIADFNGFHFFDGGNATSGQIYITNTGVIRYSDVQAGGDADLHTGVVPQDLIVTVLRINSVSDADHFFNDVATVSNFDPRDLGLTDGGTNRFYQPMGSNSNSTHQEFSEALVFDYLMTDNDIDSLINHLSSKWATNTTQTAIVGSGQSNMVAEAAIGSATRFDFEDRMKVLSFNGNVIDYDFSVSVSDHTGNLTPIFDQAGEGYSPAPAAMEYLARRIAGDIVWIPAAKSGLDLTGVNEWGNYTAGTDDFNINTYFGALNTRIQAAINAGMDLRAIYWMQGESDAALPVTEATYSSALDQFIDDVRAAHSLPALPWVIGVIHDQLPAGTFTNQAQVRAAQLNFVKSNVSVVDSSDSTVYTVGVDNVHYDVTGLDNLGTGLAASMLGNTADIP